MPEWPIGRHWKCRVPSWYRGFESPPLRYCGLQAARDRTRAHDYLQRSMRRSPGPVELSEGIRLAGVEGPTVRRMTFGLAAIHAATHRRIDNLLSLFVSSFVSFVVQFCFFCFSASFVV